MVLPVALSYLVAMVATARRPSHLDWAGTLRWAAGVGSAGSRSLQPACSS